MKIFLLCCTFTLLSFLTTGQVVSGQVLDARTRMALPFVAISIKNTPKGTSSNAEGYFSLTVPSKETELLISNIGYQSQTLNACCVPTEILLEEKTSQLNEVTVRFINPAQRIIEGAIKNKSIHDPEQIASFSYEVYHKSVVSADQDSLDENKKLGKRLKNSDLFVTESFANRKFVRPNLSKEIIVGSRTSGTRSTFFSSLTPLLQQFGFYRDFIQFQGRQLQESLIYVNPIAEGTWRRYEFSLVDTLIAQPGDSTFVIEFVPQKGKNFAGLKGALHIHSGDYALQYVEAQPAEKALLHFRLEQSYEKVEDKQWFPTELFAEWLLTDFKVGGQSLHFSIRSSLKNIQLNTPIAVTDFDEKSLEISSDAVFKDENFWATHRADSLSVREKNTFRYHQSLSVGQKFKQTALINASEWFLSGAIPLSRQLDLSIQNLFDANVYEGLRPTLNVLTNDNFSKFIRLDAKAGYGFRDQAFKYEARVRFNLNEKRRLRLSFLLRRDISEPANVQFFIWDFPQIPYELLRTFQIARADSLSQFKAELSFRAFRYATFSFTFLDEIRTPTYKYTYHSPMHDPMNLLVRSFRSTEVGIGVRYAFGEQFSQIGRGAIITTPPPFTLALHLAQGFLHFPEGKKPYTKINTRIEYNLKSASLGETYFNLSAGKTWGDVPYPYLYNGRGSRDNALNIWVANHFQTMGLYEFTSDQYANLFITHSFGNLLAKTQTKWFRPELSLSQGIAIGSLQNKQNHEGIELKNLENGFLETGLMIDNLYRQRFAKLFYLGVGVGAFRRWGANQLSNQSENWAYRIVWNVAF
jgi:Family of unknown function (DUF5686)/CarboxypepD_reg-like domain